jgi:peptidyl-prolyl cis-trans isomerase D
MSIIQTIRDKGTWLIFTLLVLALVAFIFMDAGKQGGSLFGGGGGRTSLGSVDGSKIKSDEYQNRITVIKRLYGDNPQATETAIANFVWGNMVEEKLMNGELSKLGSNYSDNDLIDIAVGKYGQPSPHILKLFESMGISNSQTGQIDQKSAENILKKSLASDAKAEDRSFVKALLNIVQFEYLSAKHSGIMSGTTFVPAWMAKKQLNENNLMGKISFVQLPYTDISDSAAEVKVSDDEIKKYIDANKNLYRQTESRSIDYVIYDFSPTAADTAETKATLEKKKASFEKVPDSMALEYVYNNNSETQPENKYYRRKELTIKSDSGAAINQGVYGPYYDNGKFAMAKVTAVKMMADTARARHILVKVNDPRDNNRAVREDAAARKIIDSVVKLYKSGVSFDTLAKRFSEDEGSKDSGGLYKAISLNQMVPEFNEFIFTKNPNDTGVIQTAFGYHFIQLISTKGSPSPAYKVAYLSKSVTPSEATRDSALSLASGFSANNRDAKTFDDFVVKNPGKVIKQGPIDISKEAGEIGTFPDNVRNTLIKWIYSAKPGEVSEAIALDKSYRFLVAKLSGITPEGTMPVQKARLQVESKLRQDKKYDILSKKYGKVSSLQDVATKAAKTLVTKDSVSFENGNLQGIGAEPRLGGMMVNSNYQGKVSGPVKGVMGVYYMQAEGAVYARPATGMDEKAMRQSMQQQQKGMARGGGGPSLAYRRKATIKDKRLED